MELSRKHIVYTLGINNQISESSQLDKSLMLKILHEQLLYETFLDSIKKYAGEKYNQITDKFNEWKDMAFVLGKVLSDSDLLNDFLKPLQRRVDNLIKPLTDFLKKIKLDSFIEPIEKFITKISSLEGWKKFMALVSVGSIITYIIEKLKSVTPEAVRELLAKTFSSDFISNILEKLTDFTSYLGWLQPIVKGVENIYIFLEPLLQAFKVALASGSKFATKLIKENNIYKKKQTSTLMKKQILSEEINRMQKLAGLLTEEEKEAEKLQIVDTKSEKNNAQKLIRVAGRGLSGGELILSTEEFEALKELAKEFAGSRKEISKTVNTKDKMSTQSTIGIKPGSGYNLELYRKQSFGGPARYKGYDESDGGGQLEAQQAIVYQLTEM